MTSIDRMLKRLRAERLASRSLMMFDVEGRLRPRYRRPHVRPAPKPRNPRHAGAPRSELRQRVEGFLHGEGAGRGWLTAELAEIMGVRSSQMADLLGNAKRLGTVRSEKVSVNASKRRWYGA